MTPEVTEVCYKVRNDWEEESVPGAAGPACWTVPAGKGPSPGVTTAAVIADVYFTFRLCRLIWTSLHLDLSPLRLPHPRLNTEFIRTQPCSLPEAFTRGRVTFAHKCSDPWWRLCILAGQERGREAGVHIPDRLALGRGQDGIPVGPHLPGFKVSAQLPSGVPPAVTG